MTYCIDYVYENYDNYNILCDEFESVEDFIDGITQSLSEHDFSWLTSNTPILNQIKLLIISFAYPIYEEYCNDKIGYEHKGDFLWRLTNSLARKINRWYIQKQIDDDLISSANLDNYIYNGGTHSVTSENASTGSAVIQKSASTPTGIQHNASVEDVDVTLGHNSTTGKTSLEVDDNYDDKYTNFVGKTNGLHRNEVDRDTDIERKSNYGLALEIIDKIPYSYINDVLKEVSIHFIQIY